ncbi:class I SAM-dependent methyltransferase [Candidatus Woesearchaeota archaeon]|nr:class I SAM-dependent methyltransferase [Candidatus Woesearchaeota archaeon]
MALELKFGNRISDEGKERLKASIAYSYMEAFSVLHNSSYFETLPGRSRKEQLGFMRQYVRDYDTGLYKEVTGRMLRWAAEEGQRPRHVLDGGSGPGISAQVVLQETAPEKMTLVDVSGAALELARERLQQFNGPTKISYKIGRVESLEEVIMEPVDMVLMRSVVRFVHPSNYKAMFSRMRDILRPGGVVLLDLPYFSPKLEFFDAACAEALGKALGKTFGIPELGNDYCYPLPESLLAAANAGLAAAGFKTVKEKTFIEVPSAEAQIRIISMQLWYAAMALGNHPADFELFVKKKDKLATEVVSSLSGRKLHYSSPVAVMAVKD